ncbi:MAG TPA: tail fiber domain-containing protein, partial [Saprospiraceae bacterium]|nr:tail fiber domain-containing protein [Saprospiraceae bacterium]
MLLNPKSYIMDKSGDKQVGFIAQELINVIPEVVDGVEGDIEIGETLGVSYGNIVAVLTKAIQEQQLLINEKDERIKVLEKKYTQLESLVMNIVSTNNHDSFNTNNQSKK